MEAATAALGIAEVLTNFVAGIYPGMPLAEAAARGRRNVPQPILSVIQSLALKPPFPCRSAGSRTTRRVVPAVQPDRGDGGVRRPECLLVDVTGLAALFGGEQALVEKVIQAFSNRGLSVQVAVADTIGAAWAAVHAELLAPGCVGDRIAVKIAPRRSQGLISQSRELKYCLLVNHLPYWHRCRSVIFALPTKRSHC